MTIRCSMAICIAALWVFTAPVAGQAQESGDVVTNQTLIDLHAAGLGDKLLLQVIDSRPTRFETSTTGLIALKQAGLSNAVMQKIILRGVSPATETPPPEAPAAPAPAAAFPEPSQPASAARPAGPRATLVGAEGSVDIPHRATSIFKIKSGKSVGETLAKLAVSPALDTLKQRLTRELIVKDMQGKLGGAGGLLKNADLLMSAGKLIAGNVPKKRTLLVTLAGSTATTVASGGAARIELVYGSSAQMSEAYQPVLVRAAPSGDQLRLLRSLAVKEKKHNLTPAGELMQQQVAAPIEMLAPGHAAVDIRGLEPGEYALMLVPRDQQMDSTSVVAALSQAPGFQAPGDVATAFANVMGHPAAGVNSGVAQAFAGIGQPQLPLDRYVWDFSVR